MAIISIQAWPGPVRITGQESIFYPESDGEPIANNTRQFDELTPPS